MKRTVNKTQKQGSVAKTRRSASRAVRTPEHRQALVGWRFVVAGGVLVCLSSLLVWKVASIQVLPEQERGFEFLQRYGKSQFVHEETIPANRGVITDRNGELLAVSTELVSLCGNPKLLLGNKEEWPRLAKSMGMSPVELAEKIDVYRNKSFMYLQRAIPPDVAQSVLDLKIKGVFPRTEYRRFYPAGEVAAHVVGITNINGDGQEGLELSYNDWLKGQEGSKEVIKDELERVVEEVRLVEAAKPGNDLQLSIDLRLQYLAYRELKKAVAQHDAVSGSVVMMDSQTGEVLAMVNQPSYNPNNRAQLAAAAMKNRAVTDQFEPGSTMKPLTVLAALEEGIISPSTRIDTSPGRIHLPGKTVFDPVNYGVLDVTHIIAESSQVGITKIAMNLDPQNIRAMFHRTGLGQSSGIGFPGESTGSLPNRQKWHPVEHATMAYGYGLTVTTLQLAHAYTVFANGGVQRPVSLLKVDERDLASRDADRVVGQRHSQQVLSMLAEVLEPGGTGVRARLASYSAGGKTGTAHKAASGGYLDEAKFSVFAGVAPLNNPRIVIGIMINEPRRGLDGGGEVAAPIFAGIAEEALRVLQTAPDKLAPNMYTSIAKAGGSGQLQGASL
ncbi:peptidoglycan D,D-transpeptidase FtsI family protein [Aurantivibrio plasticivorans]